MKKKPASPKKYDEKLLVIKQNFDLRQKQAKLDIKRFRKKLDTLFTDSDISISNFDYVCNKYGLTSREQDIVRLLMKGMLHKEISYSLTHQSARASKSFCAAITQRQ